MRRSASFQAGFTLLELVLVLAILGVLTMLATRQISQVQDQQRFDASQRVLETIREAIWGSPDDRTPDGSRIYAGFAADMGRLPDFEHHGIEELWTNTTGMSVFALRPGDVDSEVQVPGGWRGPYVRLPWSATNLLDGWGNACTSRLAAGVWQVGHLGADGAVGGTNYDQDVFIDFREEDVPAWVWGQVEVDTNLLALGACSVRVRVFGPEGGSEEVSGLTLGYPTNVVPWAIENPVPVGLRAVRAYLEGAATNRSAIRYVSLRAGTNGPVFLEIH